MDAGLTGASRAESAGVVEIGKIPKMFYTPAYGAPDVLFCSLLASAREAFDATAGHRRKEGDERDRGYFAETYMAGVLLRDENFVPARVLRNYAHHYQLDFVSGLMKLRTELYAVQSRSTSLFSICLEGPILGRQFVARDAVTQRVLVEISEEQLLAPNFFTQQLPISAYEAQRAPSAAVSSVLAGLIDETIDLQLSVPLPNPVTVSVHKSKGDYQAVVRRPGSESILLSVPLENLVDLKTLMSTLHRLLPSAIAASEEMPGMANMPMAAGR